MPYAAGSLKAKDADQADQQIRAIGSGTLADPFVPIHGDLGIGTIDDSRSLSPDNNASLISIAKSLFYALGLNDDQPAATTLGDHSLISLEKGIFDLLQLIQVATGSPNATPSTTGTGVTASQIQLLKGLLNRSIALQTDLGNVQDTVTDLRNSIGLANQNATTGFSINAPVSLIELAKGIWQLLYSIDNHTPSHDDRFVDRITAQTYGKAQNKHLNALTLINTTVNVRWFHLYDYTFVPGTPPSITPKFSFRLKSEESLILGESHWGASYAKHGYGFQNDLVWAVGSTVTGYSPGVFAGDVIAHITSS